MANEIKYTWQTEAQREYIENVLREVEKYHGEKTGQLFAQKLAELFEKVSKNDIGIDDALETAEIAVIKDFCLPYDCLF